MADILVWEELPPPLGMDELEAGALDAERRPLESVIVVVLPSAPRHTTP